MSEHGVHRSEMFSDDPQLAAFARDLQEAASSQPPLEVSATLAAVLDGRAVAPVPSALPHLRRQRRPLGLRLVIGSAVFGLGVGGLGVAGALPGPVQRQVARVGGVVGVELPGHVTTTTSTTTSTTVEPSTTTTIGHPITTIVIGGGIHVPTTVDDGDDHGTDERGPGDEGERGDDATRGGDDGAVRGDDDGRSGEGESGKHDDVQTEESQDRRGRDESSDGSDDDTASGHGSDARINSSVPSLGGHGSDSHDDGGDRGDDSSSD
jgi:hypothetical protein